MEEFKNEMNQIREKGAVKTFLDFDKMITPGIIKLIFYAALAISVLIGLTLMAQGGFYGFLGLVFIVISPLIVRVQCELFIVLFKIHESLVELNKSSRM